MERNKWEIAIRCLEVALHPNTSDDEVVAAVNGFRRTARGKPLSQICSEFVSKDDLGRSALVEEWREKLDRLSRENLDLRHEVERRTRDGNEELAAAYRRTGAAELRLAELQATVTDLSEENHDLRRALEQARRIPVAPAGARVASPFRDILAAAYRGADQPEPTVARYPAMPSQGGAPVFDPRPNRPWTA
jgi:hypothetical protein